MATPPISSPAPMGKILQRAGMIGSRDQTELATEAVSFGKAAIETIREHVEQSGSRGNRWRESWGCYDLNQVDKVKKSLDQLAVQLAKHDCKTTIEEIRGSGARRNVMNYMHVGNKYRWLISAHFDLYDLASRIQGHKELDETIQTAAKAVADSVDQMIVSSFGGERYKDFAEGKNGIYVVFPDGDAEWKDATHWATFGWYHPDDRRTRKAAFGNYDWCADGASRNNQVVENWFELMDYWYDTNDSSGGLNKYRW